MTWPGEDRSADGGHHAQEPHKAASSLSLAGQKMTMLSCCASQGQGEKQLESCWVDRPPTGLCVQASGVGACKQLGMRRGAGLQSMSLPCLAAGNSSEPRRSLGPAEQSRGTTCPCCSLMVVEDKGSSPATLGMWWGASQWAPLEAAI